MKRFELCMLLVLSSMLFSCASPVKFPVSTTVPAADISVDHSKDKNNNSVIVINAADLASPDRLDPPKNNYSVWGVTGTGSTENLGQLLIKNGEKATLRSVTPYAVQEIFITAEDQGNLKYPAGVEISRLKLDLD